MPRNRQRRDIANRCVERRGSVKSVRSIGVPAGINPNACT
jgi:hypothetical protein